MLIAATTIAATAASGFLSVLTAILCVLFLICLI